MPEHHDVAVYSQALAVVKARTVGPDSNLRNAMGDRADPEQLLR